MEAQLAPEQDKIGLSQKVPARLWAHRWLLVFAVLVIFGIHLSGLQKNLPFTPEADEPTRVLAALRMATSGDLNPGWFGHPGSTVIYPLALIYHLWVWINRLTSALSLPLEWSATYDPVLSEFYWLGRFLTISYGLISIPLVYQVGRQAFGRQVGLIGTLFAILPVLTISHTQLIRTDSASTFFGLLSLYLCLKLSRQPGLAHQLKAGLAIGLAIATKYLMAALIPILMIIDLLILTQHWPLTKVKTSPLLLNLGSGLLAIFCGFALSTPYFFLDFSTALADITHEARNSHPGADGLTPPGNLWWYLTQAIPATFTWPLAVLVGLGVVIVLFKRQRPQLLLLGFVSIFLVGISLSALHWQRWIIQVVPMLALFAAHSLTQIGGGLARYWQLRPLTQQGLIILLVVLCSAWPMKHLIYYTLREASPSTRILAREWVLQHLPEGSKIAQEAYTAPLDDTGYVTFNIFSLATSGHTLEEAYQDGFRYIIVSEGIYSRYLAEPEHYPAEVKLYQSLFTQGKLLQQFEPSALRSGPLIQIYELKN